MEVKSRSYDYSELFTGRTKRRVGYTTNKRKQSKLKKQMKKRNRNK